MPSTPAMTTGTIDFITSSGLITPMEAMPTPDFAVPYAAPMPAQHRGTSAPVSNKRGEDNHDLFPPGFATPSRHLAACDHCHVWTIY